MARIITRIKAWKKILVYAVFLAAVGQLVWLYRKNQKSSALKSDEKLLLKTFNHLNHNRKSTMRTPPPQLPILLWWDSVYTSVDDIRVCGDFRCRVTNDRKLQNHTETKIFIFYASHFKPYDLPLPRKRGHLWSLIHEESPRNAYLLSHVPTLSFFNLTSSYNMKSDYPITTQWLQCTDWLQDSTYVLPLVDKNRLRQFGLAPILYLQSDCDVPSDRDNFVKLLQAYIPVDSYGSCLHNKDMPKRLRFEDSMAPLDDKEFFRFAARYKFTLALENYVCDDYVTEKLWRPLRLGSIPIVFGAPNVLDYLPSNTSAIMVEDFRSVAELAEFIKLLDTNDNLYKEYLAFKEQPIENLHLKEILENRDWSPEFCDRKSHSASHVLKQSTQGLLTSKYDSIFTGFECFLCNQVHNIAADEYKGVKGHEYISNQEQYYCPSPRKFDQNGRYSVHNESWSKEWTFGKFEALAMKQVFEQQKRTQEKEFMRIANQLMEAEETGKADYK
ncbi:alpha-(1,3)-fucosyltransferase 10-like [Dreissena polymorpha]|uniref:alpha-(1,3)-fucosyltransferase 10-like n=1 Tax=Dreissena polymorpha TaxID=45954 RepID=UPI002263E4DA|nr:alpha-(1,3)-fucosyltransferase 10-like [Dreissena polymorpha]